MMTVTYEKKTGELGWEYIARYNEDGTVSHIPIEPGNSDYDQYLNPKAEQSTPMVTDEATTL
jgi:hypothetical protein